MVEAGDICCLSGIDDVLVLVLAEHHFLITGQNRATFRISVLDYLFRCTVTSELSVL